MPANTSKTRLPHILERWYRSGAIPNAEIITFSTKQLFSMTDNADKWENGATTILTFYEGKQFTARHCATSSEQNLWEDSIVVFMGVVDESKVTYDSVPQYDLYCELREEVEEKKDDYFDSFDDFDDMYAERMDEQRNPSVSRDDKMLIINQHYGSPKED